MNEVKFKANIKDLASLQATVSEIPEIPTPATTDEGKVLTVSVDSSGETPVAEYGLAAPASGLPAIGSGDAGKVLTVNAGETAAEWASPSSGGGNEFIINLQYLYDDQSQQYYVYDPNDTAFSDILDAVEAGKAVFAILDKSEEEVIDEYIQMPLIDIQKTDRSQFAKFCNTLNNGPVAGQINTYSFDSHVLLYSVDWTYTMMTFSLDNNV